MINVEIVEYTENGLQPLYAGKVVTLPRQGEIISIEVVSNEKSAMVMFQVVGISHWLFAKDSKVPEHSKTDVTLYVTHVERSKNT